VLHIYDILLFLGSATCNSRAFQEGAKLEISTAHLFAVGRMLDSSVNSELQFCGMCLTSKIDAPPHSAQVTKKINDNGDIQLQGNYSCHASINQCKHVVGHCINV